MNPIPKSWRDRVNIHPAANLFPLMPGDELLLLGKDIAKNGLREQIALLAACLDGSEEVSPAPPILVDGRNRLAAIELAVEDPEEREKLIENALANGKVLNSDVDPWSYVVSANLHRRHLSLKQKREVAASLLKQNPERSDLATAKLAGLSDKTITGLRTGLAARSEIPNVKDHVDTAGRRQPARKATKAGDRAKSTAKPPKAQQRDKLIVGLINLLHRDPVEALDDLIRLLRDEHVRIIKMVPEQKRIAIGREFLVSIGVEIDHLSLGGTTIGSAASATPFSVAPVADCLAPSAIDASPSSVVSEKPPRRRLLDSNDPNAQA
jgi:hypothetical protein